MDETKIKEAFQKVKEDIIILKNQLELLTQQIEEIKRIIRPTDTQTDKPTDSYFIQTHIPALPTQDSTTQAIDKKPKNKALLERPKPQNFDISTGNRGVPADRPTDRQTNTIISSVPTTYQQNQFKSSY